MSDWKIPESVQPKPGGHGFDLDTALRAVVSIDARVPEDAFTAGTLGVERSGNGVLIEGGLVLTIGYLVVEAEEIWIGLADGTRVPGHLLGYDYDTGFGLVIPLVPRTDLPTLRLGSSAALEPGTPVVVAGAGGRTRAVEARVVARQEFAGYWEYLIDEAIFTVPSHPHWGGTALIGPKGELVGIGSLQLEGTLSSGRTTPLNMAVPIDLLKPILDDLRTRGRADRPARPWLGVYVAGAEEAVAVVGIATGGPADRAGLREGDLILAVDGDPVSELPDFYRRLWAIGTAGVNVPLTISREGDTFEFRIRSGDRQRFLKTPRLH